MNTEPENNPFVQVTAQATTRMAVLESKLAPLFKKAPHLPPDVRETIVGLSPWIALVVGALGIFAVIPALSSVFFVASIPFASMMMRGGWYPATIIVLVCMALASVLSLFAYKPLIARQKKGWNLLFYATNVSALSSIVNLVIGYDGLGGIIGAIVGCWLLFEVREMYKA
jgi:hypothetical protein